MEPDRKTALRHPLSTGGRSPNNPIFLRWRRTAAFPARFSTNHAPYTWPAVGGRRGPLFFVPVFCFDGTPRGIIGLSLCAGIATLQACTASGPAVAISGPYRSES